MSEAITSWRIASQGLTWKANDLSGNGSALNPGRWNSLDQPLVYSSSSIALACAGCGQSGDCAGAGCSWHPPREIPCRRQHQCEERAFAVSAAGLGPNLRRLDRWHALSEPERDRFPLLCPDLVVELASPSDAPPALRLGAGTIVWGLVS